MFNARLNRMFYVSRHSCRVTPPLTIRNDWPIVGWVFGGAWVGGLVVFTYLYARDGGFGQFDPMVEAGVMMLFWMAGLVLISQTLALSRTCLTIGRDRIELTRTWLWRRRQETLSRSSLRDILIEQERDSDGDPYYKLVLQTRSGERVALSASSELDLIKARRDDILARIQ